MAWQRVDTPQEVSSWFLRGTPGSEIAADLAPRDDEAVFDKLAMSAFAGTPLEMALRDLGIRSVAIVGVALEIGIAPTVWHAVDLGFVPVVVTDACDGRDGPAMQRTLDDFRFSGDPLLTDTAAITQLLVRTREAPLAEPRLAWLSWSSRSESGSRAMAERTAARKTSSASAIRFAAQVQPARGSAILRLPADASAKLPSRGQVAVTGVVNGHAFQAVLEPDGRRGHWLKVGEELRQALAASDGDTVSLTVEPAKDWPEPDIPHDFLAALADAPDISEAWQGITPMARWEWVRWINATRNFQTRERRIGVAVSKLRSGKRRPCCFDLAARTDPHLPKNGQPIE